ncbi:type VI secretion system Vgr family protein [Paraferrimonas sedimenticola]|uniref:Type VI secretion protein VgrG n=1 Tax=Paraferrimonas sedimenticola TaxID=375674 RepID=A0AA37RXV2_9GAMM|nr:type VI secretion system tip protein TssI/VgrG [Paraferrimonas sedimenticola]GLP96839.1 type VI secretion protein VgrG [Paraferrimonas sedimenticola]
MSSNEARFAEIASESPQHEWRLISAEISEEVDEGVTVVAQANIDNISSELESLLGSAMTIRWQVRDGKTRYINALVDQIQCQHNYDDTLSVQLVLRDWFYFLSKRTNSRCFQSKTTKEIVDSILEEHSFGTPEWRTQYTLPTREHCIQFAQSDQHFIRRLLAQDGLYFYFVHDNGEHKMVITDSGVAAKTMPGYESVPMVGQEDFDKEEECFRNWKWQGQHSSGRFSASHYSFERPRADLSDLIHAYSPQELNDLESFSFYGGNEYQAVADRNQLQSDAIRAKALTLQAQGSCRGLGCGFMFALTEHIEPEQNKEYLVTYLRHSLNVEPYRSGDGNLTPNYQCDVRALPNNVPYCSSPRRFFRSLQGIQTATVVGPSNDDIWTDEYGRVKVQFHWDRKGNNDEKSSHWIRVAQSIAGNGWGSIYLPRVGQEVLVSFIDGDPDNPLITGTVYNAACMPPWKLPDERHISGYRSLSTPNGGRNNEIHFDDKAGEEAIVLHAQSEWHRTVGTDSFTDIEGDEHHNLKGTLRSSILGELHQNIKRDRIEQVKGDSSQQTQGKFDLKIGMNAAIESGMNMHLQSGVEMVIESGIQITLKAGGSFITIGPAGVAAQGPMVTLNSGGGASSGSGASPKAPEEPKKAKEADGSKSVDGPKDKKAPEKRRRGGIVKVDPYQLAAAPGSSPQQVAARKQVAIQALGGPSFVSEQAGIDFNEPVTKVETPEGPALACTSSKIPYFFSLDDSEAGPDDQDNLPEEYFLPAGEPLLIPISPEGSGHE